MARIHAAAALCPLGLFKPEVSFVRRSYAYLPSYDLPAAGSRRTGALRWPCLRIRITSLMSGPDVVKCVAGAELDCAHSLLYLRVWFGRAPARACQVVQVR